MSVAATLATYFRFIGGKLVAGLGRLAPALMMIRSKTLYLIIVSLMTFSGFFSNLYLAARNLDISYVWTALVELALTSGGAVHRLVTGLQVFQGSMGKGSPVVDTFLQGLPQWFTTAITFNEIILAFFLILTAISVPYILYRFTSFTVTWLSSTDMAIEHNLGFILLYMLLVVIYSLQQGGSGFGYLAQSFDTIMQFLDSVAEGGSTPVNNTSVNDSVWNQSNNVTENITR